MKKIYFLFLGLFSFFVSAQPYSSLLKNASWTITKIQWNGVEYFPPSPLTTSGKVAFDFDDNGGFQSTLYNSAMGKVTFGNNNATHFSLQNVSVTLGIYMGENEEAVRQFDGMTTHFYHGFQPAEQFNFVYEEIFSARNLVVTNPSGNKIFYSNLILASNEADFNSNISIYPNPAKNEFFLKSNQSISGKVSVEIFDASGKLVSSQKAAANEAVNIQSLPNGVYVVKVKGLGVDYSTKLMVKK